MEMENVMRKGLRYFPQVSLTLLMLCLLSKLVSILATNTLMSIAHKDVARCLAYLLTCSCNVETACNSGTIKSCLLIAK